jgi:hypothetical protein
MVAVTNRKRIRERRHLIDQMIELCARELAIALSQLPASAVHSPDVA